MICKRNTSKKIIAAQITNNQLKTNTYMIIFIFTAFACEKIVTF